MPTGVEIGKELDRFYRGYVDAFNRQDPDRVVGCFAIPYGWVTGERGLAAITNEGDHRNGFSRLMLELRQRGWVRSGINLLKTWALSDNLAMTLADFTRYRADGSMLENGRACYTALRDSDSWKIIAITEIKPPFLGPGDCPATY
jgi:hypothetical protein